MGTKGKYNILKKAVAKPFVLSPWLLTSCLLFFLSSCGDVPVVDVQPAKGDTLKENLINANRVIAQNEETQIDAYVERRGRQMQRLACGARVVETHGSHGPQVGYEDTVAIRYSVEAINGTVIYSNLCDTVVSGRLQPTRGLDAALRTLGEGSKAVVILPSEQAYGVAGDGDRVKSRMVLIYNVEVLKVMNRKTK